MSRLHDRLARLEDAANVSARAREAAERASGPSIWEEMERGLVMLGCERLEHESGAEWFCRAANITLQEFKHGLRELKDELREFGERDVRKVCRPGSVAWYIGGLLAVARGLYVPVD